MKKILFIAILGLSVSSAAFAQPGGFQRRTPEERVATIHAKLDSAFKLEPSRLATLDTALTALFKQQDEKMRSMFSSGERPDRDVMRAEMQKYTDARDEMIKAVISAEQYAIWKEKIEPSMRRPREGGGGN